MARQSINAVEKDAASVFWLAKLQWILFTLGLFFVMIWIAVLSKVA
jgi:hypothetical protein